jgi:hypothetical protein
LSFRLQVEVLGYKRMVSSFDAVRPDANVLLYTLLETKPNLIVVMLARVARAYVLDAVICHDDVAFCVCFHSFPLKIELEVERTHMTNDEGIYFRRYSRDGKLASEGGSCVVDKVGSLVIQIVLVAVDEYETSTCIIAHSSPLSAAMSFRQDSDPGSVKSLLALLRSNQDANTSNHSNNNNVAGGSATATPPPAPPAANDPYSLASNPFHQATYGHSGSLAGTLNGHQHQPERAHAHGYDYGYQHQNQPGSAQTVGSSLQDLLATLRRNNTDSISPRPSGSASREIHSHPSWIETLTGTERRERERDEDRSQVQASGSKRRRIEREAETGVEAERDVDPYAEDDQHRGPERGYEYDSYEGNGTDDRDHDHDNDRPAKSPQPEHIAQVEDPPHSAVIDLSENTDNDNAEAEEEEDDRMNRYGYTPEQMANLSIEEGKPIVDELITRVDVVDKLKKVRLARLSLSLLRSRCMGRLRSAEGMLMKKKLTTPLRCPEFGTGS